MLSQRLSQKLQQKLSPQQILLMKLLQVPAIALEQRINQEIETNPALEDVSENQEVDNEANNEEDSIDENSNDYDISDFFDEDEVDSYKVKTNNTSKDQESKEMPLSNEISFQDLLINQLSMMGLSDKHFQIGLNIIGNLDDTGYLSRDIRSLVDDFEFSFNISTNVEEVNQVLEIIQSLDPPGVGARNLQECILIQLKRVEEKSIPIKLAIEIIEKHFERFSKKHYDKIIEKLDLSESDLKLAISEIEKINPKPGNSVSTLDSNFHYIVPDFIVSNNNGKIELTLNNKNTPELRINQEYAEMLQGFTEAKIKTEQQKEAILFIKQKIDSARWFIDAIKQRNNTLYSTMLAIIEYQKNFFIEGNFSELKPMKLKDISDITSLDISTVSRVVNSKYVQTHFGIFLLKDFFSKSLTSETGEDVSTTEVKTILLQCIENEDKRKPLNDDYLTELLSNKGFKIARRTVAKYRESLGIPVARLRKEI